MKTSLVVLAAGIGSRYGAGILVQCGRDGVIELRFLVKVQDDEVPGRDIVHVLAVVVEDQLGICQIGALIHADRTAEAPDDALVQHMPDLIGHHA